MCDAIYCEVLKLKKSYFFLVVVGIILFLPVSLYLGWLKQGKTVSWNYFVLQVEQINFLFINLPMFSLISAFIYTREFSCNTAQSIFTYPIGRTKIFFSKLIVIVTVTFSIMLFQALLTFLLGTFLPHEALTKEILLGHLRINLYALVFQYAILPLGMFVALISKNTIMPVVYSGVITVINIGALGMGSKSMMEYIPTLYPIIILLDSLVTVKSKDGLSSAIIDSSGVILPNLSIIIAVITFIFGISLCIIYNAKADID